MDNQSLLTDSDVRNLPTCSANVGISLRTMQTNHTGNSFENRYSSELDSIAEYESDKVLNSQTKRLQRFNRTSVRSMKNPGILMTANQKSHKLSDRFRYHIFVIYHPSDRWWVNGFVKRLESAPMEYKCCLDTRDFISSNSEMQNIICSLMLSERVVLVISEMFLKKMWSNLEDLLLNSNYQTSCQTLSKVIGIIMDKSTSTNLKLPNCLKHVILLNSFDEQFWQLLSIGLRRDPNEIYSSNSTLWSIVSQTTPLVNGQIMYLIKIATKTVGLQRPFYNIEIESSPQSGGLQEAAINNLITDSTLEFVLDFLHLTDSDFSCMESRVPVLVIVVVALLWIVGFLLVIFKLPDTMKYTLPIRLCVFIIPATILITSIVYRWKLLERKKMEKLTTIYSKMTSLNWCFYNENRNILATIERNRKLDILVLYLVYYSVSPCVELIRQLMKPLKEIELSAIHKFVNNVANLQNQYSKLSNSQTDKTLQELLSLTLASSYLSALLSHRLQSMSSVQSPQQRHTRKYLCLCQYIEEMISNLVPCIRYPGQFNLQQYIKTIYQRYLHSCLTIHNSLPLSSNFITNNSQSAAISKTTSDSEQFQYNLSKSHDISLSDISNQRFSITSSTSPIHREVTL